jgi:hypothetical protein
MFYKTDLKSSIGKQNYFEIEIPDIWVIPIYGVVVNYDTNRLDVEIVYIDKGNSAYLELLFEGTTNFLQKF